MSSPVLNPVELRFRQIMSRLYWGEPTPSDWTKEPRQLCITALYADYSKISAVVIQVNGSPPKGSLFIAVDYQPISVVSATFIGHQKSRTIPRDSDEFKIVSEFVKTLHLKEDSRR